MNHRTKIMLMATIFFFLILIGKSLWIDPVGKLEGDLLKYKSYAQLAAPHQPGVLIIDSPVVNYRVISVRQTNEEGETLVLYKDQNGEFREEALKGQYTAKVRSYFLSVLPLRDVKVKGGLSDGK